MKLWLLAARGYLETLRGLSNMYTSASGEESIMTSNQTRDLGHDPTVHDPRQRRAILVAVCIARTAVIASVSALNVAQPELAVTFDASQTEVLWFINLNTISLAALLG